MRLFLAEAWIESARQRLAKPAPSEESLARAGAALDKAAALIAETGYQRRAPDLALARAEWALATGDMAAAETHLATLVAAVRAHDLWSFVPELARLAARAAGNPTTTPLATTLAATLTATLADLRTARATFDQAADAAFAEARKRADGLDDDVVDARLADPTFRRALADVLRANGHDLTTLSPQDQRRAAREYITKIERPRQQQQAGGPDLSDAAVDAWLAVPANRAELDRLLVANGYKPSAETPLAEQRNDARQYLKTKRAAEAKRGGGDPTIDPSTIPDELVDQGLADPEFCAMVDDMLGKAGQPKLADQSSAGQRIAVRAFIATIMAAKARAEAGKAEARTEPTAAPDPSTIPDEMVDAMLADADMRKSIDELHAMMGLPPLADLPLDARRMAVRAHIAKAMAQGKARADATPDDAPLPPGLDPDAIPDAMVDAALADDGFRGTLSAALTQGGHPPLDRLPPDAQRNAARQLLAAMQAARAQKAAEDGEEENGGANGARRRIDPDDGGSDGGGPDGSPDQGRGGSRGGPGDDGNAGGRSGDGGGPGDPPAPHTPPLPGPTAAASPPGSEAQRTADLTAQVRRQPPTPSPALTGILGSLWGALMGRR